MDSKEAGDIAARNVAEDVVTVGRIVEGMKYAFGVQKARAESAEAEVARLREALEVVDSKVSAIMGSEGWREGVEGRWSGDPTEWVGPWLHNIQDAARAALAGKGGAG